MSSNGLIAPTDVCRNANPESAFFVRVGQPIAVPSPFQIVSASGLDVTSITVDSSGNTIIDSAEAVVIPGSLTVDGKPIAKAEYKPYVGVVGLSIQVPTPGSIQQISEDFSVIANHTYKISMQARIITGDTNPGAFVALICKTPASSIGLGEEEGGPSFDSGNTRGFFGTFKAPASANNCKVEVLNSTIASVVIQLALTDISLNPGVLIEDLGIL